MEYLRVKKWENYQHYKNRNPPWIKLHVKILNDRKFSQLSCTNKGLLVQLWVLASENNGQIPADLSEIRFRLRDKNIQIEDLNLLIQQGFLVSCKHLLADDNKKCSETETEKTSSTRSSSLGSNTSRSYNMRASVKTDPRVKVFLDWYCKMYEIVSHQKYAIPNGAKLGKQIKQILKSGLTWTDIQICAMCFLADDSPFLIGSNGQPGAAYDIGVFLGRMNKYDYAKERKNAKKRKWLVTEAGEPLSDLQKTASV